MKPPSLPGAAPDPGKPSSRASEPPRRVVVRVLIAAIAILFVFMVGRYFGVAAVFNRTLDWISSLGAIAPLVFIIIYIIACVLFLPASILTIGSGVLFGLLWGSIYVLIGATTGALCAFLVGRYIAREWVARKLERFPKFKAVDAAVGREGWKIVALTRLSPIFPFNFLNYAFGLTRVTVRDYIVASSAGIIPGTVMYVYLGSVAGDLTVASGAAKRTPEWWAINIIGLLATVAIALYVASIARKALNQQALGQAPGCADGQSARNRPSIPP